MVLTGRHPAGIPGALLFALAALTRVADCTALTAEFEVAKSHGPVKTRTGLPLNRIRELAAASGRTGKHGPLGFYVWTFVPGHGRSRRPRRTRGNETSAEIAGQHKLQSCTL